MATGSRWVRGVCGASVVLAAVAGTTGMTGAAGAPVAARPEVTLVFDKNPADPSRSTLTVHRDGQRQARYRAGSGDGSTDDCAAGRGWLPDGDWRILLKDRRFKGGKVRGYGIRLENMRCAGGAATRTEMFVHSEMHRDGGQGDDEPRRWDGEADYLSDGCVKLRPDDIKDLFARLDGLGWPERLKVTG
ncbi:L,D-transpeptidase [Streptomyces chilikensis]|uniref:L,D-transpeptidase family protein n=1 Tax=Streptomyces chilikensis TaxID=1194079 RepID=A0ABV3EZD3_9ACTN|nr:L,D-transpeptidase [Streptomyces chilikensis]